MSVMRHDCKTTSERLIDLLFGEIEGGPKGALLEEVVRCEACASQYRTMAETLRVFDEAAEMTLPTDDFWPGYEERLRMRMSQEIQQNFWQQAAFPFARGGRRARALTRICSWLATVTSTESRASRTSRTKARRARTREAAAARSRNTRGRAAAEEAGARNNSKRRAANCRRHNSKCLR